MGWKFVIGIFERDHMSQLRRLSILVVIGGLLFLLPFTAISISKDLSQAELVAQDLWHRYQVDFGNWLKLQDDPNSIVLWSLSRHAGFQDDFDEIKEHLNGAIKNPSLNNASRYLLANFCAAEAIKPAKNAQVLSVTTEWCRDNSIDEKFIEHDQNNARAYLSAFIYRNALYPTKNHHQLISMAAKSKYYSSYYGKNILGYHEKFSDYFQANPYDTTLDAALITTLDTDIDAASLKASVRGWALVQGGMVYSLHLRPFHILFKLCKADIAEDLRKDCISISNMMLSENTNMRERSIANSILIKFYSVDSEEYKKATQRESAFKIQRHCLFESKAQPNNQPLYLSIEVANRTYLNLEKHSEDEAYLLAEESLYNDYPSDYAYPPGDCRL